MSLEALNIPRSEFRMTIPQRGISVVAPSDVAEVMAGARERKQSGVKLTPEERATLWSDETKARIKMITGCKILKQRYPNPQAGREFMERIDFQRTDEYLGYVGDLTEEIVKKWGEKEPKKPLAVVLFGSVAKGLIKSRMDPDPSNIDLTVIGNFDAQETNYLLDSIRDKRDDIARKIRQSSPNIDYSIKPTPGSVGIHVQNEQVLRTCRYGETRVYLASGAFAVYDPSGIWERLKNEALNTPKKIKPRVSRYGHLFGKA